LGAYIKDGYLHKVEFEMHDNLIFEEIWIDFPHWS
jgi:hypothetical protein